MDKCGTTTPKWVETEWAIELNQTEMEKMRVKNCLKLPSIFNILIYVRMNKSTIDVCIDFPLGSFNTDGK